MAAPSCFPMLIRLVPAAAVPALAIATCLGQQPATFRSAVDTVEVQVVARASNGQVAGSLTRDDFELYDNNTRRDIMLFSAEAQPITIALMLDRSGSIANQAARVTAAAEAFVRDLLPSDRAAVNTLSCECQPLTSDKDQLLARLRGRMPMDPDSPIWATLDRTISAITREPGRRAILLFSDGDDHGPAESGLRNLDPNGPCRPWAHPSEATLAEVSRHAQRDGVTIFTVSVEGGTGRVHDDELRAIARDSGGERYRLKAAGEIPAVFRRIADALHHQYLLGFIPAAFDGRVHELEVRVRRPGVLVSARRSYAAERIDSASRR
jgi:Ca-activated chloride channel family protein